VKDRGTRLGYAKSFPERSCDLIVSKIGGNIYVNLEVGEASELKREPPPPLDLRHWKERRKGRGVSRPYATKI